MAMFRNPAEELGDPYDVNNSFDYNLEADKVLRRKKIAQLLKEQALSGGGDNGSFVTNQAGTFYMPGSDSGLAGAAKKIAAGLMSRHLDENTEASSKELSDFVEQRNEARMQQLEQLRRDEAADAERDRESQSGAEGEIPTVTVRPDNRRSIYAAMLKEGGSGAEYARNQLAAMDAPPSIEYHDGYLVNMSNGASQRIVDPEVKTEVVEANGRKLLVNSNTGDIVKDLGSAKTADASEASQLEAINAQNSFESADAGMQGTIDELRLILENKGGGSIEDAAGSLSVERHVPGTNSYDTKFNVERVLAQKIVGGLKEMKASGVGTSAFNSDKEAERLEKAFGSINWNSEKEARRQLNNIYTDLLSTQERMRKAYEQSQKARGVRTPSFNATPPDVSLSDFNTGGATGKW